jgi:uncharacterized protein (DUF433 family)/DNA-binding transcriptional MerR regulator
MDRGLVSAACPAERAAALAGVPKSTLYYWARTGLVIPSVSRERARRWSYADLLVLRLVDWLRHDKPEIDIPRSSMQRIRRELSKAEALGENLLTQGVEVYVDARGRLVFGTEERMYVQLGHGLSQELVNRSINLVRPFETPQGMRGPDLVWPRPTLRILPGKLSGEPHVDGTRIPTNAIAALRSRDFGQDQILELYTVLTDQNVLEAIDLESQLEANLHARAA